MKKIILILISLLLSCSLYAAIEFSGGESRLSLREGREEVVLSGGAWIEVDSIRIEADEIRLTGTSYRYVQCNGNTSIVDKERGISIRTGSIWFDREEERLVISSWFEVEDTENEVSATGFMIEYRMAEERLEMGKQVKLLRNTDDGLMRCQAESVVYSRSSGTVALKGNASVYWNGDRYQAEAISVNLDDNSIRLEGRIKGSING